MKDKIPKDLDDELRPEYDLAKLELRKVGPGRRVSEGPMVRLDPDVVKMFPDSRAVNEALRFLIRVSRSNDLALG